MEKQPEIPLWRWVDPYTYRSQLTLPKLIINGTNDRYWVIDAMNLYWDDLVGEKHVLYVPNAGHGLDGGKENALTTLAVFAQHVAMQEPLPDLTWKHDDDGDQMRLVGSFDAGAEGGATVGRPFGGQGFSAGPLGSDASCRRRRRRVCRSRGEAGLRPRRLLRRGDLRVWSSRVRPFDANPAGVEARCHAIRSQYEVRRAMYPHELSR